MRPHIKIWAHAKQTHPYLGEKLVGGAVVQKRMLHPARLPAKAQRFDATALEGPARHRDKRSSTFLAASGIAVPGPKIAATPAFFRNS
jgi:hypothetical protein